MSYQKHWVSSFTHKSVRMMTMCPGSSMIRRYLSEVTVEPVLFLYMLSTFSQYALFQDLVYSKVCWSRFSKDSDICQNLHDDQYKEQLETVQTESSHYILLSTIALIAPSILISMYLGSWSDDEKVGRKWPVVFPPLGGVCACLVYIVISVIEEAPVGWICLASLLSGLTGGFVSCIMSCMTYVASVTTEENRTVRISRLEAMTFFGGTVGPFVSGTMLEITGHAYAFFYMMLCYAFAFLYAILFVKDITKDGIIIENDLNGTQSENGDDIEDMKGVGGRRSRNKSSETIPSSVVATTLSTSSGGEDLEQKVGLLSASSLHVSVVPAAVTTVVPFSTETVCTDNDNVVDSNHPDGTISPELALIPSEITRHNEGYQNDHVDPRISQMSNESGHGVVAVVSASIHNDPHDQRQNHDITKSNRNSVGSCSSEVKSGMHVHDDGSSAASDDDQRKIFRRRRHSSSVLDDETGVDVSSSADISTFSSSSCCLKYFGTAHFLSAVLTVLRKRENGRRSLLILSILAGFMFMVITAGEMDVAYLYARAEPLKWSYQKYSYYFGFKYGLGAFVLLVATPMLQKLGIEDTTLAIVGMISRMAALVVYGLSSNSYMAFTVPAIAVFSVFTIPATRSLLSKLVSPGEQGKMFAFVAMMEDICTLSASLIFNSVYPLTRPILQGLIFLLAAASLIIPICVMCFVRWKMQKDHRENNTCVGTSKAQLHSVDQTDPATLLCIPKDFPEVGKQ